jgi:hypothetical protein
MSKSKHSKFRFKETWEVARGIRKGWGFSPVERVVPSKKTYNRQLEKKVVNND